MNFEILTICDYLHNVNLGYVALQDWHAILVQFQVGEVAIVEQKKLPYGLHDQVGSLLSDLAEYQLVGGVLLRQRLNLLKVLQYLRSDPWNLLFKCHYDLWNFKPVDHCVRQTHRLVHRKLWRQNYYTLTLDTGVLNFFILLELKEAVVLR